MQESKVGYKLFHSGNYQGKCAQSIQDWESVRKPETLQAFADHMYGQLPRDFDQIHYKVESLPFDQHQLIASMALWAVYVASAMENLWADPKGEFLSLMLASWVYG